MKKRSVEREGERAVTGEQGQEMPVGLMAGTSLGREGTRTWASILGRGMGVGSLGGLLASQSQPEPGGGDEFVLGTLTCPAWALFSLRGLHRRWPAAGIFSHATPRKALSISSTLRHK